MLTIQCFQSLMVDIDKIISGESSVIPHCDLCAEEYSELIFIAELLAKTDYASIYRKQKILQIIHKKQNDELEDEDLDMVAAGHTIDLLQKRNITQELTDSFNKKLGK